VAIRRGPVPSHGSSSSAARCSGVKRGAGIVRKSVPDPAGLQGEGRCAAPAGRQASALRLYVPRLVSTTIAPPAALRPYSGSATSA
jgi:hypothetical protein